MRNYLAALLLVISSCATTYAQEMVKPGKEHELLAQVAGNWDISFDAGGSEMKGTANYKVMHGGLWVQSEVDAKMPIGPFSGTGLDSYDPGKKKYVSIWVDSMSTSPLVLEGTMGADGKTLTMTGKGPSESGAMVEYKTVTEFVSKDKHVFKMWMGNLSGDPMMTAVYTRKK